MNPPLISVITPTFNSGAKIAATVASVLSRRKGLYEFLVIDEARFFLPPPPASDEATHWPDITALCRLMAARDSHRYVAVHDDVIIGVPAVARMQLVEFLRAEVVKNTSPPVPSPKPAPRTTASPNSFKDWKAFT
jgi:hypothetical protein